MGNWEQRAIPVLKWAAIPLAVFGFGYFVVGPMLSGGGGDAPRASSVEKALVNQQPIEPGERKWIPVSPPQVNVSVTRKVLDDEPENILPEGEPPPIEIPEDGTVDEAGVGGLKPPVATGAGDSTTGAATAGDTTGGAFRGIGGRL
jgi:hypothetical protein